MSTTSVAEARKPLAERLIAEGTAIVAADGAESLSLREVQRRAGVSPAAAYRHFRDRDDLLSAIAQRAADRLTDRLEAAMAAVPDGDDAFAAARARLVAASRAYVRFAEENPGLYQAIFASSARIDDLGDGTTGRPHAGGAGGYELLVGAVQRLVEAAGGGAAGEWDPLVVWSTSHGLAMLRTHPALRSLPADTFAAACDQVFETVIDGVAGTVTARR